MSKYLKKPISQEEFDTMRINLSVREKRLSPEPVCDWCGDAAPVVTYAASRMSTGEVRQCWRWCACERCERMVDYGNWDAVQRKVTMRFTKLFGAKFPNASPALISRAVAQALDEFHQFAVVVAK